MERLPDDTTPALAIERSAAGEPTFRLTLVALTPGALDAFMRGARATVSR